MSGLPKKILVPVDFTEPSNRAFDYAVELAKQVGGTLYVLHAYDLPIIGFGDGVYVATSDLAGRMIQAAQTGLAETTERAKGCNVEVVTMLKQGDPRSVILQVAREVGAEMVVMGTHGRRGFSRALIGSVAENVVRTCTLPVLTIHAPAATEALPA
jgi:nucleotide-binding universal stress UspA family protein